LFSNNAVSVALAGICEPTTVGTVAGCNIDSSGFQLERLAKHSFQAQFGVRQPITDTIDVLFNFDAFYQSKRFIGSTEQNFIPGYWDSDLRIGFETKQWSAIGYVSNVFDNQTVRGGFAFGDFHPFGNAGFALQAAPRRQFGVRLGYNF